MREPARCGLFTVCEVEEEEARERERFPTMMSDESFSSLVEPHSGRLSWTCDSPASSEAECEIATPNLEEEDPFTYDMEAALGTMALDTGFDFDLGVPTIEEKKTVVPSVAPLRPRRPPRSSSSHGCTRMPSSAATRTFIFLGLSATSSPSARRRTTLLGHRPRHTAVAVLAMTSTSSRPSRISSVHVARFFPNPTSHTPDHQATLPSHSLPLGVHLLPSCVV